MNKHIAGVGRVLTDSTNISEQTVLCPPPEATDPECNHNTM